MRSRLKRQTTESMAEQALETWGPTVFRIALGQAGSPADAEDICQTVLIKLLEHPRDFPDTDQERAWVIRIAVNDCKNWRKTAWFRHRAPLDEGLRLTVENPEPESGSLLAQVQALPAMYREVIFLRYYEGYEVKEIATLLGRSPALVSTHLKRGKEKLRNMLGGTEYAREF